MAGASTTGAVATTTGGAEYKEKLASLSGVAFSNDKLVKMFIAEGKGLETIDSVTVEDLQKLYYSLIDESVDAGGEIIEAGSWAGAALWRPPKSNKPSGPTPTEAGRPSINEYMARRDAMREKYLDSHPYWMLHVIARNPEKSTPGAIRAVFEPYLKKANEEGVPIWLEATNAHAREVYRHFGFEVVETASIGEGTRFSPVTFYGMLYTPQIGAETK